MKILVTVLVLLAGMMAPTQAGINARLSQILHSNILAALVSFCVGTAALLLYSVALKLPWPPAQALARAPFWVWLGGLCGAFLVTVTIMAAPRLGATVMFAFFLTGQMLASLLLDHFGLFGYPVQPLNLWRVVGVVLLVSGLLLIRRF